MNFELDDDERAALAELLKAEVDSTKFLLSPRITRLRAILAKLGIETRPPASSSRHRPGEPSAVVARMYAATISSPPQVADRWFFGRIIRKGG